MKSNSEWLSMRASTSTDALTDVLRDGAHRLLTGQFAHPTVQPVDPALISLGREVGTFPQTDPVTQQAAQLLGKGPPRGRFVAQIHLLQLAQQMEDALLPISRLDRIVRSPEVGDEYAIERFREKLL